MTILTLSLCELLLTTNSYGTVTVYRHTAFVLRNAYGCVVNVRHKPLMLNVSIPLVDAIKHVAGLQCHYCRR